jgi:hypothetical protein
MFYVLQEFTVPRCLKVTRIAPEHAKFSKPVHGVGAVNVRQGQHLKDLLTGLPVACHGPRLRAVPQACLKAHPSLSNPADKFAVDLFGRSAAFAPVQNKLRSHRVNELKIDAITCHYI